MHANVRNSCTVRHIKGAHTVALTNDGGVFTFGAGEAGQLGLGSHQLQPMPEPTRVAYFDEKHLSAAFASCGAVHTAITVTDGSIYTFGDSRYGKLGTGAGGGRAHSGSSSSSSVPQRIRGFEVLL